jgi:hypothetical protein
VFRRLWSVWVTANVCMWMNDVAAAWLMTSLSPSPVMVALVQSASTLPVFLLGCRAARWPTSSTGALLHRDAGLGRGDGAGDLLRRRWRRDHARRCCSR